MATLLDIVKKGSVDRSVCVRVIDNTTGLPATRAFNDAGVDLWYRRQGAAVTSITEATLANLTTAHADGGFLLVANGEHRLDLPDAAFATGAQFVDIGGTFTGYTVIGGRVRLVDYDPEDTVRLGLTAMPNAASGAAGAILTSGTGTAQLSVSSGATIVQSGTGTGQISLSSGKVSPTDGSIAAATFAADAITAAKVAADVSTEIATAVLAATVEAQGTVTLAQSLSLILAVLTGVTTVSGATYTVKTHNGSATRVTFTLNASKERTAVTLAP